MESRLANNTSENSDKKHEAGDSPERTSAFVKPLVVRPRIARQLLGGKCEEKLWELINAGVLESYLDGRARLITMASIERYINNQIDASTPMERSRGDAIAANSFAARETSRERYCRRSKRP
jgi:hypothetical protein